jgi:Chain length determinant protein
MYQFGIQIILTFLYDFSTGTSQAEFHCILKRRTVMSAMDFKQHTDLNFPHYAPPAVSAKEIDLLGLLDVLLAAKKRIITIVFAFALVGLAIAF